ncbi:hypothetical protein GF338_03135 [candidate division WOR-3 bacterium]|nr:hypothetical protein [candidate division WOR-3 bacterium]
MKRRLVLVDMSHDKDPSSMSKEARKAYAEHTEIIKPEKVAMVGANPVARMVAKIALSIMGRSDITKFFKTEDEALAWLKGDK